MLPVARYPRLVEWAPEMTAAEPEFHYRFGIDLFVAGARPWPAAATRRTRAARPGAYGQTFIYGQRNWHMGLVGY